MPDELAISEDFERYDDADELRRLIRTVKFAQKHFLYFVCCNQVPKQNELIAAVEKEFKGKKIRVVKFKKPVTDLLGELQKKKIAADCEAVFVQGLEWSISSDGTGAENALIYNLNISRDSFKRYLSCPLFIWLPEYAIVKITRHAPDFFSVRSGTFYFSNPLEQVAEQILQSISSSWNEVSSLSVAEKLKQIEILESLLAEYRGLHREKQDKEAEGRLLSKLADFYASISDYQKSIEYIEKSLQISQETENQLSESILLSNLAIALRRLGNYKKAIKYQELSLTISRKIGYQIGIANSLGDLANAYSELNEDQKADEFYKEALQIFRGVKDQQGEHTVLGNLGNFYNKLGESKSAIKSYKHSLKIARKMNNKIGEGNSLGNMGSLYHALGEYTKAIEYYELSLNIARELGNRLSEGANLNNLGFAYYDLGYKNKACKFWKDALNVYRVIKSPRVESTEYWIAMNCEQTIDD